MEAQSDRDPHRSTPVLTGCASQDDSRNAIILLHGRGGSPQDMLALADVIGCTWCSCLAPQAAGFTWYPYSFLEPQERNEPFLSSAIAKVDGLFAFLYKNGFPSEKVVLLGFSQGACLALEYGARNPRRYGGLIGLSGGLIGPPGNSWDSFGNLEGTPVFLGCSDIDPHIPKERVELTAKVFEQLGGQVTERFYPLMGHTINQDEIDFARSMLLDIRDQ